MGHGMLDIRELRNIKMIKLLLILCALSMSVKAESLDELKQRFMNKINSCKDHAIKFDSRVQCQLAIANEIYVLLLIEQMKESSKK